jgi:cobalt-zinc-cadmium efflux system membrane fusion protein
MIHTARAGDPRRFSIAAITAIVVLGTAAAAWLWAHEGHQALPTQGVRIEPDKGAILLSRPSREALDVQTAEVVLANWDDGVTAPAVLAAPWQRHAYASTTLSGKITALLVQPGQIVTKGQILAEVQSLELEDLQRDLLIARDAARLSAANLQSLESANRQGSVTARQLREYQSKNQDNLNALTIARRKLTGLGVTEQVLERLLDEHDPHPLRTLPVTSLIGGVVLHVDARVGQIVEPNEHLFEIVDPSSVWVKIAVLEKDLAVVEVGQRVELSLTAHPQSGTLRESVRVKGLALDPRTHQGSAWTELANPAGQPPRFLPGMTGRARLLRPSGKPTLTVPEAALIRAGAESYVLVEEGPGQYVRRNVVLGRHADDRAEVSSPQLVPGDRVVTAGSNELGTYFVQGVLRLSPEASRTIGLQVEPARRQSVDEVLRLTGAVELPPSGRAIVSSPLAGTIRRIAIDRDQSVVAGAVVAEVASLELHNLQLELLRNHLDLGVLEQTRDNIQAATESGSLPVRLLREAASLAATARQRRDSLRRKLEAIGLTRDQLRDVQEHGKFVPTLPIRAPIAGAVVRFRAALGQAVKVEEPLFEIHDLQGAGVRAVVSEWQLGAVQAGQRGRVRLTAEPKSLPIDAVVARTEPMLGDAQHTLAVWADLTESPKRPLLHGTLAELTVVLAKSAPVLAVPRDAALADAGQSFLFVRRSDGVFERRGVQTGRADDRFVEIRAGLQEGEVVAISAINDLQTAFAGLQ